MLDTFEEYVSKNEQVYRNGIHWSEPKFQCAECGGNVRKNEMLVLTSFPPQYQYVCDDCDKVYLLNF